MAGLIVLAVLSDLGGDDDNGTSTTVGLATTTTRPRGFPPAPAESVCRNLISIDEIAALTGRQPRFEVIEPETGQCAWPTEEGNPNGADLFFLVLPRSERGLREELDDTFAPLDIKYRLDPVPALSEEAYYVIRLADPQVDIDEDFVEGLYVHHTDFRVVLANGGQDVWPGSDDEVKNRLIDVMTAVLGRVDVRTTTT